MILKIFNVKHLLDKSKRQKQTFVKKIKYNVEGYETEFCWTDDEIHYFLTPRKSRPEVLLKVRQISLENIYVKVLLECFLKNRLQLRSFPVKFAKILRTTFFKEHQGWLLLESVNQCKFKREYEGTNWESVR